MTVYLDLSSFAGFSVNFDPIVLILALGETFLVQAILLQNSWQILGPGMK